MMTSAVRDLRQTGVMKSVRCFRAAEAVAALPGPLVLLLNVLMLRGREREFGFLTTF